MAMNTDKAYIFGMVIGGGIWGDAEDYFHIRLPFKQWGSYFKNPQRASQITRDIMNLNNMFRSVYGITVQYDTDAGGVWNVICEGDTTELRTDLAEHGISCEGEMRKNTSITKITAALVDDFMKRRFIAGLADTIGSTAPSQRRFTEDKQIISFELSGFNFSFVCDLCRLFYSVNCLPDQILWNHPNFHSAKNPHFKGWKKGFKLRVLLDQYAQFGAFAFKTKAESSKENLQLQHQKNDAVLCPELNVSATASCVHPAEHDANLPSCIRGGHYLHNRHVCAVLGCENAPYGAIKKMFADIGELVNPFPILCKDKIGKIEKVISDDPLLANRTYQISAVSVKSLYDNFQANNNALLYGNAIKTGYPISQIMQGIAYIIAHDNEIGVTRVKGKYTDLIERHLAINQNLSVELRKPNLLTPLVIMGNGRGALVGARNPAVYKKLVSVATDNEYKLCVRPITEGDLQNA
ncbi:MAG: hypothetical protein KGZ54_03565 [Dethiobacter sp.]|nr:hypothetical protein [Dethiobacter sp.]MBS3901084.1 hypothetical protein [Dethiobacter sp.]MBS3988898.1 hypothetical protein [Dethiobacter sp.]